VPRCAWLYPTILRLYTSQTALALTRVWHHTSAHDRILGNLASRIAWVLMGKHKPTYDPAGERVAPHVSSPSHATSALPLLTHCPVDAGDYVVVSDALAVRLTGKKAEQKVYRHHSGFIGGLKEVPISRMRERRPEEVSESRGGFTAVLRRGVAVLRDCGPGGE
jgi:large subunit ribosomal protein L13